MSIKRIKNACSLSRHSDGADDRGRTDTDFTPPDFESGASANSTTSALTTLIIISYNAQKVNPFL